MCRCHSDDRHVYQIDLMALRALLRPQKGQIASTFTQISSGYSGRSNIERCKSMNEYTSSPSTGRLSRAITFSREWVRAPLRVGAVSPSGPALAKAMANEVTVSSSPVIELGPGTGVFTSALRDRGIADESIVLIESNMAFANTLAERFPNIRVIRADACQIRRVTPFGKAGAGTIICGLPLLSMPPSKVQRIVSGGFQVLRPGGVFRLFSYGPNCPVPGRILERLGVISEKQAFVPMNLPPAFVFNLFRKPEFG